MFYGDWCSELRLKKVRWQNRMAANFSIRKMYSTGEKLDGCDYSIEIIIVPLKERVAGTNFYGDKHTIAEGTTKTMDNCNFSRQNKYSTL